MKVLKLGARFILTAISAVLYGTSFTVGLTLRIFVLSIRWVAASLIVGWTDAWPRREVRSNGAMMPTTPTTHAPMPEVLGRELARMRNRR